MMLGLGLSITRGGGLGAYPGADLVIDAFGRYGPQVFRNGTNNYATLADMIAGGGATFSRASDAYLTLPSGALQLFAAGQARNAAQVGFLPEQGATNLLLRSQEFNNASWSKINVAVTADAAAAPDGTATADFLTPTTSSSARIAQTVSLTNGSTYSFSLFVKAGTSTSTALRILNAASSTVARIDLTWSGGVPTVGTTTGTTNPVLQPLGNGWYRITGAYTAAATENHTFNYYVDTSGTAATSYAWGAQLETGSFSTSYIKSEGSAGIRLADNLSVPYSIPAGQDFTVFFEQQFTQATGAIQTVFYLSDGTDANRIRCYRSGSGAFWVEGRVASGGDVSLNTTALKAGARIVKGAISRAGDAHTVVLDGVAYGPVTLASMPSLTALAAGMARAGNFHANDPLRILTAYPYAMPTAQMQAMTQ